MTLVGWLASFGLHTQTQHMLVLSDFGQHFFSFLQAHTYIFAAQVTPQLFCSAICASIAAQKCFYFTFKFSVTANFARGTCPVVLWNVNIHAYSHIFSFSIHMRGISLLKTVCLLHFNLQLLQDVSSFFNIIISLPKNGTPIIVCVIWPWILWRLTLTFSLTDNLYDGMNYLAIFNLVGSAILKLDAFQCRSWKLEMIKEIPQYYWYLWKYDYVFRIWI